jgi:hypothetical protein
MAAQKAVDLMPYYRRSTTRPVRVTRFHSIAGNAPADRPNRRFLDVAGEIAVVTASSVNWIAPYPQWGPPGDLSG